jgi:tetratricopeptide (TPR) repeat protein
LDEAASIFLSEAEAAEVLNRLYQYADESDVEIVSLQERGAGEVEAEGTGAGEEKQEKKDTYDVRVFRLQVEGTPSDLIAFVSRIEEAAYKGFVITNVNIAEGEERPILTMDITLYTSPYSPGAAVQATPVITPVPTPANLTPLEESLAAAWASEDWEQAIVIINEILALDPNYDDGVEELYTAYVNYGYLLLEEGDNDAAIMQFNLALAVKPDGAEALTGLQQAIVIPTPTLTVEEQLVKRLDEEWEAENWEEVISLIEQILAISALITEGRLEEAKEEFSLALVIKPGGVEATAGLQQLAGGAPPPAPPPESEYTIHVVQPGENLFRISLRYGVSMDAICAANGITDPTRIHVGQQLRITAP